ncbi:MAG: hypothetical protein LV481_10975 [Methylacidiphilales bacterium]|nr:hypothetical protein [Candidatus Methylacidiphilales bacterium]
MRIPGCRPLPIRLAVFLAATLAGSSAFAADDTVSTTPPVAALKNPATLDVVTFDMFYDDSNHKMVVTLSPTLIRLDAIEDRYSIIYDPHSENYIGLEHSNDTYWQFSWPEVKEKVAQSKRYEEHMRDLLSQGIGADDLSGNSAPPPTNGGDAGASAPAAGGDADTSGYIWRQTGEHKEIAGLDCVHWTGESAANPEVDVWCYTGPLPAVRAAFEKIRAMNEPMALVPVRTLVPEFVFTVYDSLVKGGSTPVLVTWGSAGDKNKFALAKETTRANKPEVFSIPKLYNKTTLITMDGITQPIGGGN